MKHTLLLIVAVAACGGLMAASEVRWTGGGADTRMTTPENWAQAVNLTDGSVLAVFGDAGSSAQVVGSLCLNGIKFDRGVAFSVMPADASAELLLGEGGLAVTTAAKDGYTVSSPVKVVADQTWNVSAQLSLSGPLTADASHTITKTGDGVLEVSGGGDFVGNVEVNGANTRLFGENAFGTGAGTVTVHQKALTLAGATVCKDVHFDCGTDWNNNTALSLWEGTSVVKGKVSFSNRNFRIYPYKKSSVTFENGFDGAGYLYLCEGCGGRLVFSKVPATLPYNVSFLNSDGVDAEGFAYYLDFNVASNSVAGLGSASYPMRLTKITTTVDWAFDNTKQALQFGNDSVWDLCGTSQRVGMLYTKVATGNRSVVTGTSATPSKLYLTMTQASTPAIDFTGNLSVDFSGACATTIDHAMAATGELSVQAGTLAFTADGSWANASKLTVASGAAVTTAAAGTFGMGAAVVLNGTGTLSLPAGVTETVSFLTVGGVMQPRGEYAMGSGTLKVLYSGKRDIVDRTLIVGAGESVTIDDDFQCDPFDKIVLGDGAKLDLRTAAFFPENASFTLTLGTDAELTLAEGIDLYVPTISGAAVGPGRHTSADLAWLKGGGAIYVPYGPIAGTDVQWTGSGSDELVTTTDNWSGAVDLVGGTSRAVFATGTKAVLTGWPFFNGLSFATTGFTVMAADASAGAKLASGGLSVTAEKCSLSAPVEIAGDQTWNIEKGFVVNGALMSDSLARYALRKTGGGDLNIVGEHGTFAGSIDLEKGSVLLTGEDPLGASGGSVNIGEKTMLTFAHATVSKPVRIAASSWNSSTGISVWGDREPSEIKGKVTMSSCNIYTYIYSHNVSHGKLTFSGGIDCTCYPYFTCYGGGANNIGYSTVVFTNRPFVCTNPIYPISWNPNRDGISYKMYFAAAGNTFATFGHGSYHWKSGEVHTTADGAFDDANMRAYFDYDFTWDLHGTWQRVGFLESYASAGHRPPVVTNSSETAATLYFNQRGGDWTNEIVFGGKLNVVLSGNKTLTVKQAMTAEGGVTVASGTLAFDGDGSWRKSTAVTVTGSGRVTTSRSRTFGKKSVLTVDSAASLQMAAGTEQWVSKLVIGGVEHTLGDFTFGSGTVHVGVPGLAIIVR